MNQLQLPYDRTNLNQLIKKLTIVFLSTTLFGSNVNGANILAVFPHIGKSHNVVFQPLVDALAIKGHNVQVISFFPKKEPLPNYTDITVTMNVMPLMYESLPIHMISGMNTIKDFFKITGIGLICCEEVYSAPSVQKLLKSDAKFDLIIFELFQIDCFLGIAHIFKAPFIGISSSVLMPIAHDRFANPDNPAFIPNLFTVFGDKMNYQERVLNTVSLYMIKWIGKYYYGSISEQIARKYVGDDMPPLTEIAKNMSLVLVNAHPSLNRAKPQMPSVIDVNGLHLQKIKKLDPDLQSYIDNSKNGVILFTMGSTLLTHTFPEEKRKIFVEVFEDLPQNIIWKWENDTMPDKPKNVKIVKWLPQRDILAHPNVIAFISHCGLLGTTEAVDSGVPMLGMPMYGDQGTNCKSMEGSGIGICISYADLTKVTFRNALLRIINDKKYKENSKRLKEIYHDRPLPPLETALFWTEHVLKFGGARYLRSVAVDMPWYQYYLLDVILGIITALATACYLIYKLAYFLTVSIISNCKSKATKTKKDS